MKRPSVFPEGWGVSGCCQRLLPDSWALISDSTSCRKDTSVPHAARKKASRSLGSRSRAAPKSSLILSHSCLVSTCASLYLSRYLSRQPCSRHTPVTLHRGGGDV